MQLMMVNLNRISLTGYLARDPALRELPSGKSVCDMLVACHHKYQDHFTGAEEERVEHLDVRAVGALAAQAHQYLRTGSAVAIEGRLSNQPTSCHDPAHKLEVLVLVRLIQFMPMVTEHCSSSSDLGAPAESSAPAEIEVPLEIEAPVEIEVPLESRAPAPKRRAKFSYGSID
jgi:single stranded DNA-binding protein